MFEFIYKNKIYALTTKGFMQADDLANNAGNIAKPVNNTITTFKTVYNTVNNSPRTTSV